ncbi:MAG: uroporphyrinogen decarboxylase family protein [Halanaerobiales bacterium]
MTARERLLAVFNGEEPDYIPWSPLVDYYFLSSIGEDGESEKDIIKASRELGFDLMERHVPTYSEPFGGSMKIVYKGDVEKNTIREGNKIINRINTPVGNIEEIRETTEKIKYGFIKEHYLTDMDDVKIYKYILENIEFESLKEEFAERDREIGEAGLAVPSGPLTPIQQLLQFLAGVENTIFMVMDNPEEMEELFELIHKKNKECYQIIFDYPSPLVIAYEDTSTTVISPDMYRQYCKNYIDEYSEIAHKNDKLFITHMCGTLSQLTGDLAEGKMDGIDSMCPPTSGDLWPYDARKEIGEEKIIIGGIEPASLKSLSRQEVREYVIEVLKKMAPGKNFILSSGDATPHGTPVENMKEVAKVVREYGKYPLNI